MHDGRGINAVHLFQVLQTFLEEPQGFVILHIADMLARDGEASLRERKGVLEVCPAAEHVRPVSAQDDGLRRIPPGAADDGYLTL